MTMVPLKRQNSITHSWRTGGCQFARETLIMVQKSILSFFAAKPAQGAEGGGEGGGSRSSRAAPEESPVKRSVKRRSRMIESDSEEEDNRPDDGERKNKKLKEQEEESKKVENVSVFPSWSPPGIHPRDCPSFEKNRQDNN
ncbi:uncharacterized protein LOC123502622 [Portunus trituberculatus]|uniref:uncharacterized protein LOC123502622 n=1 Tax=Portunus trituberculatus TaxID=210409 RepID=UPI001E1CB4DD|nr:uncharacterized protein LOC123502622 [Portunus trituberculatus]